jgi:hypothetical protein
MGRLRGHETSMPKARPPWHLGLEKLCAKRYPPACESRRAQPCRNWRSCSAASTASLHVLSAEIRLSGNPVAVDCQETQTGCALLAYPLNWTPNSDFLRAAQRIGKSLHARSWWVHAHGCPRGLGTKGLLFSLGTSSTTLNPSPPFRCVGRWHPDRQGRHGRDCGVLRSGRRPHELHGHGHRL